MERIPNIKKFIPNIEVMKIIIIFPLSIIASPIKNNAIKDNMDPIMILVIGR